MNALRKCLEIARYWIISHTPNGCMRCGSIVFHKDTYPHMISSGQVMILCQKCHNELYHPFSSAKKIYDRHTPKRNSH